MKLPTSRGLVGWWQPVGWRSGLLIEGLLVQVPGLASQKGAKVGMFTVLSEMLYTETNATTLPICLQERYLTDAIASVKVCCDSMQALRTFTTLALYWPRSMLLRCDSSVQCQSYSFNAHQSTPGSSTGGYIKLIPLTLSSPTVLAYKMFHRSPFKC